MPPPRLSRPHPLKARQPEPFWAPLTRASVVALVSSAWWAVPPGAVAAEPGDPETRPGDTAGQSAERVPDAAVVKGVPQGMFVGRSLLTGRAVCLLFLADGRVTRAIPTGGLESFSWMSHQAAHRGDVGRWQLSSGQVQIAWGDGGVHQGPLTETPDGIEFYGKRYARPAIVTAAALAGRWEAARGTAISGGQGVNALSGLVIGADGRYRWSTTTGGTVAGRTVADVKAESGTLRVSGATMTFRADEGTARSFTFVSVAGRPVAAFTLDATMFARVE